MPSAIEVTHVVATNGNLRIRTRGKEVADGVRASATGAEGSSMLVEEEVSIFAKVVVPRANTKENPGGIPGEETQFPGQRPAPANGSR